MIAFILHIIILIFCCCSNLLGQAETVVYHNHYTVEDGLPSNEIFSIHQSDDGRIWMGTDAGLVSFDGIQFKQYQNSGATNAAIDGIISDNNGDIWCLNFGSQIFHFHDDSLHLVKGLDTILNHDLIRKISCLPSNKIAIQPNSLLYDPATKKPYKDSVFDTYRMDSTGPYFNIDVLWLNDSARIYVREWRRSNEFSMSYFAPSYQGKTVSYLPHESIFQSSNNHYTFEQSPLGPLVYIRNYNTTTITAASPYIFVYRDSFIQDLQFPKLIQTFVPQNLQLIQLTWQDKDQLWLSTSKGIFYWNLKTGACKHYCKAFFVTDLVIDHEQNIWASTLKQGVLFIPSTDILIHGQHFINNSGINHIASNQKERLLIAHSKNKLTYWDANTDSTLFEYQYNIERIINRSLFNPQEELFYVVRDNQPISIFDAKTLSIEHTNIFMGALKKLQVDRKGNLWFSLGQNAIAFAKNFDFDHFPTVGITNLDTFDMRKQMIRAAYPLFYSVTLKGKKNLNFRDKGLKRTYSIALQENPNYAIWIANTSGLFYMATDEYSTVLDADSNAIIARDLCIIQDSVLWVATNNKGLYQIKNKKVVQSITTQDGLPSNQTSKIVWQAPYLWIATQAGLARYDVVTQTMLNWSLLNGLPSVIIKDIACTPNRVYFSDGDKLMSSGLEVGNNYISQPLLNLTDFRVNDVSHSWDEARNFAADSNSISIHFRGISLKSQGKFIYKYRLLGSATTWQTASSRTQEIRYPNLRTGNYQFELFMEDLAGQSRSGMIRLNFSIRPPFYQTWWFYLCSFLVTLGGAFAIFKWQLNKVRQQTAEREQQAQLALENSELEYDLRMAQLKALKAQMNPHFIFNVLNSIQGLYIVNDKAKANLLLSQFAHLIRSILDMSEALEVSLEEEVKLLKLYLEVEQMRVEGAFDFKLEVDPELYELDIYLPALLIQPYVENAIKHGLLHKSGTKYLNIHFEWLEDQETLRISIEDNGIGRKASSELQRIKHRSFSTSANAKRLELLNTGRSAPLYLEFIDKNTAQHEDTGTIVRLNIPL